MEKFSDSGNSRRFDYQENGPAPGGFMTSTPHTKSQAVFSPPKSYQVGQTVAILIVHHFIFVPGVSFLPFNEQTLVQGSYGPWKT